MATALAFAIANRFDIVPDDATEFLVSYQCIVGDGVDPGVDFTGTFPYYIQLGTEENILAAKKSIAETCADIGFTVEPENVKLDLALK